MHIEMKQECSKYNLSWKYIGCSGVGTGPPNVHRGGSVPPQTLEGYNMIIIMPLSTKLKAVIQVHQDPLHAWISPVAS